jgi:hypothetical protein
MTNLSTYINIGGTEGNFTEITASTISGDGSNIANITGANVIGTVATANIASTAYSVAGANVTGEVASANVVTNSSQTAITQIGVLTALTTGGLDVNGLLTANANVQINGNLYVAGNITFPGNINQVSGNSGQFFGNADTGFGALYAGIPAGYTLLAQEVMQYSTNFDGYTQVSIQNINTGNAATGDFIVTADNGNDETHYADFGIASSGYLGATVINGLGTSVYPNDAYLYAKGNVTGGNLVLGTVQSNGAVRIITGASDIANVRATFDDTGLVVNGNITGSYLLGNGRFITGLPPSYSDANVTTLLASGNVTSNIVTTQSFVGSGTGLTNLVPTPTAGDIVITDANGNVIDSNKFFNDTQTSINAIWSSSQTSNYVNQVFLAVPNLPPVNLATTANVVTRSGNLAIDGVTTVPGDFVLVKNQTNRDNGIWLAQAGAWVRQIYDGNTYANVTTQTTYNQLGTNNGIVNVLAGTVNRNLQFQISPTNPNAAFGATNVNVTSTNKLPIASLFNRYVDTSAGNDTTNNGSSAFPFATITRSLSGISTPATISVGSSGVSETSVITWVPTWNNITVQGFNMASDGGQTTLTGVQTFASGTTRNDFVGTTHSTGTATPFVFQTGALMRNYFQSIIVSTTNATWLSLPTNASNWISFDNITVSNFNPVIMPAFTNAFTFNIINQFQTILFSGTGAVNTLINIQSTCQENAVRVAPGYLGLINWNSVEFGGRIGSTAFSSGIITNDTDLTTITGWTTNSTYDGIYWIRGFTPANTNYRADCLIGKQTGGGITQIWYVRLNGQLPPVLNSITGAAYVTGTSAGYGSITTGNVSVGGNLTVTGGVRKGAGAITTTATLTATDAGGFIQITGGPYTVTLPDPTLAANSGIGYKFWQNTASNITLSTPAGAFLGPSGSTTNTVDLVQATTSYWDVWSDGANWIVFGIKIA